jgi:hypothetical protein
MRRRLEGTLGVRIPLLVFCCLNGGLFDLLGGTPSTIDYARIGKIAAIQIR